MREKSDYAHVHKRMMRYVFLQTELLLNDDILELSEYDIQSMIFAFFRSRLEKYHLEEATRETDNKTDIVINQKSGEKVYLELKTYFKPHESFRKAHFDSDFRKLLEKAVKEKSRAYFIIAGSSSKFAENKIKRYAFLHQKYLQNKKKTAYVLAIGDAKVEIRIRPSIGQSHGRSRLWSWEIIGK
jgi:hypothetical protein